MDGSGTIAVLGASGLVGGAVRRALAERGGGPVLIPTHDELDLEDGAAVHAYFDRLGPSFVFMAAAKVGGIVANSTYPADFIRRNLLMQTHVFEAAHRHGVRRLLFFGSSCIYPRDCPQPMREEHLLTGPLEATNEAYAIAKIAGVKMAQAYRQQHGVQFFSVMPTNIYGCADNFDPRTGHVIPGMIARMVAASRAGAEQFEVWGSGSPRREFLHCDDLASAAVLLMEMAEAPPGIVNVGTGQDLTIRELAVQIASLVGFGGRLVFNEDYPDGAPRKLLDIGRITALGWRPRIRLADGLAQVVDHYVRNVAPGADSRA